MFEIIGGYILSIILSYFMIRQMYINDKKRGEAKNNPIGFLIFLMFIPGFNILEGFVLMVVSFVEKFNWENPNKEDHYKKLFRIK